MIGGILIGGGAAPLAMPMSMDQLDTGPLDRPYQLTGCCAFEPVNRNRDVLF